VAAGQVVLHEAFTLRNTTEPQDLPKSLAGHVHSFNIIVAEARAPTLLFGRCSLTAQALFLQLLGSFGDNEFLPGTCASSAT
jgi:hypothetical protein